MMTMPVRVSGLDRVQARQMIRGAQKAPKMKPKDILALMPLPENKSGAPLAISLGEFFADRGLRVLNAKSLNCESLECWLNQGRRMDADWILCAVQSQTETGEHLVLELVHVATGKTLVSETARLEKGQKIDEILLERLKARGDLGL